MQLWLDADDANNDASVAADGSTVATWIDKSGNANNATAVNTPTLDWNGNSGKVN